MTPDYELSARKAAEALEQFKTADPLSVLNQLQNVTVISFGAETENNTPVRAAFDAITMMSRKGEKTRYIVLYNKNISQIRLRFAMSRELGHILLEHDDQIPADIRDEEAGCFAHHFLCPLTNPVKSVTIHFRPKHQSQLWELKCIQSFDSMEKLKKHIAEERNRFNRFIGKKTDLKPEDVQLSGRTDFDILTGWKNCYNVVLDGQTVGYCGE